VSIEGQDRFFKEVDNSKEDRRKFLKNGDKAKYLELVSSVSEKQSKFADETLELGGKVIGYFAEEIMSEMDYHAQDQMKAQVLSNLMQRIQSRAPTPTGPPKTLTKEEVIAAFKVQLSALFEVQMKMI